MPAKCPTCGTLSAQPYSPFCSERCASVDLGNWFSGKYAVPAVTPPDEEELDAIIDAMETGNANISGDDRAIDSQQGAEIMPFQRK
jgi:endogenous inhibitor of DNA gyrase (YacG/DUF329 family)